MMKIATVDERDTTCEYHNAAFRVFIYEGPANAVTVYEISDCPVEEALNAAEMLSFRNEKLWSLALVVKAPPVELTWMSGMDYNDRPSTLNEWRLRGQMQTRYLRAKLLRNEDPILPNGLKRIRMFPEWGVDFPLWGQDPDPYPYSLGDLPIPQELGLDLASWGREWGSYGSDEARPDRWKDHGWLLFDRLQSALNGFAEVHPRFDDRE